MFTLCTLLTPGVNFLQGIVNVMWFPLTFLGSPVPNVADTFNAFITPLLGCSV